MSRGVFTPLLMIALAIALSSCVKQEIASQTFPRKVSLGEAERVLGVDIPKPSYLPAKYEMSDVYLINQSAASLTFSRRSNADIILRIQWVPDGFPPYRIDLNEKTVQLRASVGQIRETSDDNVLTWNWIPDRFPKSLFVFELAAPKGVAISEVILIADSVDW